MKLAFPLALLFAPFVWLAGHSPDAIAVDVDSTVGAAEIRFVDAKSGRGIPLVELETVSGTRFVSDNAGRVAFHEPGLMGRELFFSVRSHGYDIPKDGFGISGVRVVPIAGKASEFRLTRKNLAERLCRLTGEGAYRDTRLLGRNVPLAESAHPGRVAGQDSVQVANYRDRLYWFWGDTMRMDYPLGLYRMAGATTPIPDVADPKTDPADGIAFDYFADAKTGFARAMMPLKERPEGVVWVESVFVVPDDKGKERMLGHYTRRKGLDEEFEQGIALFDDEKGIFESAGTLPLTEAWRKPRGQPIAFDADGTKRLLFGSPNPNVRVAATLADILDSTKYEAYTCADPARPGEPNLGADGRPIWRWQKELPPTDSETEHRWIGAGKLKAELARFCPADASTPKDRVRLHRGSVRWNPHRKCWVLIAVQFGGKSSHLGEVWYSESMAPTGPFAVAVKVVTHDRQTFYNPCHHAFLDRDGGRTIHFEGTYTNDFSGNPDKTPRYNYNQILYRLDLDTAALAAARAK